MRFDPTKVLLDPYGRGVVVPPKLQSRRRLPARRQRRHGDEERGGGSQRLRLGRGHAAAAGPRRGRSSTRCMCAASPAIPVPASRRGQARHLRRADREDPLSAGTRHHRGRTAAGLSVRRAGLPAGQGRTTGATRRSRSSRRTRPTARARTRSARSTSSATWSRRCIGPDIEVILDVVFNHTAEGDENGPTLCFRGIDNRGLLHPGSRTARATPTTPARATRSTPIIPIVRRLIVDSLRYWVERDARRRLPLRPRLHPLARRQRGTSCPTRPCSGTSNRTRCWRARS